MDHGGGGGSRSSSRLRDRLARMFRPASLLRSTCSSSSSSSACGSSSRVLLAAVARDRDSSFHASSRRDYAVGRTESFSTAVDRLQRRAGAGIAPEPPAPARFSVDALPTLLEIKKEKEKEKEMSPREHIHHRRLGGGMSDRMNMKLLSNPYGFSSSDNDDGADVFSSDTDDPGRGGAKKLIGAETFFSSDSSEFYTNKKKKHRKNNKKNKIMSSPAAAAPLAPPKGKEKQHRRAASRCDTCGVRDRFRPVVSAAEEQLRRGFAVVKRSRDPYGDFRSSMVEMIVGRQLFGAPELERLLRSYLSLNAARHHPVILQAFSDIWVVLHGV